MIEERAPPEEQFPCGRWASNLSLLQSPLGTLAARLRAVHKTASVAGALALLLSALPGRRSGATPGRAARLLRISAISVVAPLALLRWVNPPSTPFMTCARLGLTVDDPVPARALHRWVRLEDISPEMVLAVLVSEDAYFFWHFGVNPLEIWRAYRANCRSRKGSCIRRGGSTLTQQLAKNLFLLPAPSYRRKAIELVLALLLEGLWSKERILESYLNVVHFGEGVFGVEAASQYFFGQPASDLTAWEASLMTAALRRPSLYQLRNPSADMREIQSEILDRMAVSGWLLTRLEPTRLRERPRDNRRRPNLSGSGSREERGMAYWDRW